MKDANTYKNELEMSSRMTSSSSPGISEQNLVEEMPDLRDFMSKKEAKQLQKLLDWQGIEDFELKVLQKGFVKALESLVVVNELDQRQEGEPIRISPVESQVSKLIQVCLPQNQQITEKGVEAQQNGENGQKVEQEAKMAQGGLRRKRGRSCPLRSKKVPPISLVTYFLRHERYLNVSDDELVVALIYILRASGNNKTLKLDRFSCHKLFSTSILLAKKYLLDVGSIRLEEFAFITGVNRDLLMKMEAYFLDSGLGWRLFVSPEEFTAVKRILASIGLTVDF